MSADSESPRSINTVFRIVWTDPPQLSDFESHAERGDVARFPSEEARRIATGVSVFRTLQQARRTAMKRPPWLGRGYIAQLIIPFGVDARIERTTKSAGHYTLWAAPASIMSWVVDIVPVSEQEDKPDGL
jgi:hypothetical protein